MITSGGVIAALSVSGPVYRLTEERAREIAPSVALPPLQSATGWVSRAESRAISRRDRK